MRDPRTKSTDFLLNRLIYENFQSLILISVWKSKNALVHRYCERRHSGGTIERD
eukprot:TRINITY_DN14663_c0_g1_i1.p2 TRINITY_DN14663_c0_g1~~TRINITY_DN14663_c0_g1_i1.p2  ORF type:complete len:54 (-),score=7.53 TRINITY_DN14663_c0_g1_i1:43-204(-)